MQLLKALSSSSSSNQSLTTAQVTAFLSVAQCGSFSQAALRLGLSQPALSQRIKHMESALGEQLFDRSRKTVVLSRNGEVFLPFARRLFSEHIEMQRGMNRWRNEHASPINVTACPAVMPVVTFGLLQEKSKGYGNATLHISEAPSSKIRQQLLSGQTSLAVCADTNKHPQLLYTPVLELQLGLLASPQCKLPDTIDSLDALRGVPMVKCSEDAINTQVLRKHCPGLSAYFDAAVAVEDVQEATELLLRCGMATVATAVGATHGRAEKLLFIPLPDLLPVVFIYIVRCRDAVFDAPQEHIHHALRQSIHAAPWHESVRRLGAARQAPPRADEAEWAHA